MSRNTDIDRLIDDGLHRYSVGDFNGALVAWERVLAIEPSNPQATSYVGYVRVNVGTLQSPVGPALANDVGSPFGMFGVDEHPEYVIESSATGAPAAAAEPVRAAPQLDAFRDDWFIEDDVAAGALQRSRTRSLELSLQFALDDDEASGTTSDVVNFESSTTEYSGMRSQRPSTPGAANPFYGDETPLARPSPPPHLEVRVRSPSVPPPPAANATSSGWAAETSGSALGDLPSNAGERTTHDMAPRREKRTTGEDLIASLPVPRRVTDPPPIYPVGGPTRGQPKTSQVDAQRDVDEAEQQRRRAATTHRPAFDDLLARPRSRASAAPTGDPWKSLTTDGSDLSPHSRASAAPTGDPWKSLTTDGSAGSRLHGRPLGSAPSELHIDELSAELVTVPVVASELETATLPVAVPAVEPLTTPVAAPVIIEEPLVRAPTRELHSHAVDEEEPTRQAARISSTDILSKVRPGGRAGRDFASSFQPRADPIDACAAQILDEIDAEGGRIDEPKDDRIRRRVTALLARAAAWNESEPEKAVCAVELALSEDPNSALAQKLIHRNRDAIMNVFQNYLGDLEHKPQLDRPLHELGTASITPRAAFLLSRIDGQLTLDEILDVSGMPRLEAYRHLSQLFLHKILS